MCSLVHCRKPSWSQQTDRNNSYNDCGKITVIIIFASICLLGELINVFSFPACHCITQRKLFKKISMLGNENCNRGRNINWPDTQQLQLHEHNWAHIVIVEKWNRSRVSQHFWTRSIFPPVTPSTSSFWTLQAGECDKPISCPISLPLLPLN